MTTSTFKIRDWNRLQGAKLRAFRKAYGHSCKKVASLLGYSASHLSNLEAGRTAINAYHLRVLADFYDLRPDRIYPTEWELELGVPGIQKAAEARFSGTRLSDLEDEVRRSLETEEE